MGRYSEYVICLFNCVYEQDSDIWQRQPSNFSKAGRFAFGKNHIRSQATGNTEHSEFPDPLRKTAICLDDMLNKYVGERSITVIRPTADSGNEFQRKRYSSSINWTDHFPQWLILTFLHEILFSCNIKECLILGFADRASWYDSSEWPTWCTITLYNTFIITVLYMFRATLLSSSGGQIVLIQHLV